ncbi:hypothetical protein K7X08_013458 [Anisodus acutangulus]|uniref:Uncharacterized protein n=1 Tax=Anisodus acutangulus TaxID=402998 RepID=A0A9Q1LNW3_9SOLA|nr:hypothetical protein K7X08_013458 [Anisodus acutangulus]
MNVIVELQQMYLELSLHMQLKNPEPLCQFCYTCMVRKMKLELRKSRGMKIQLLGMQWMSGRMRMKTKKPRRRRYLP